ncbi:PREDICTED: uncharacterized protein LOC103341962 [Prunus mume]|uniref:Uncharacterized protein LOC103341962 n=1 Tax=Prunus mume TaxID=102107 RepID=A0ABM0PSA8_PRUMU|nr:PREDICTED: uncharacterized protein LOC103341962 [Prunus mume]
MSSMLSSQGLVLATAMAVSSTLVFLAFSRQKTFLPTQLSDSHNSQQNPKKTALRSCLCSGDKKRERKKKKVHFAENVEEPPIGGGEEMVMRKQSKVERRSCRNEIPENRIALYNGILKNRVQRMQCSH